MHKVINSFGDISSNYSEYCPSCGSADIEQDKNPSMDFNEQGWFYSVQFSCNGVVKSKKCNHKWVEKVVVSSRSFKL